MEQNKNSSNVFDQRTIIAIIILILISSQLWTIAWDIGKAALYIVILLLVLTFINPETADKLKDVIKRVINLDGTLVTNSASKVSEITLSFFKKLPKMINLPESEEKQESEYNVKPSDTK